MRSEPKCGSATVDYCGNVFSLRLDQIPPSLATGEAYLRCTWRSPKMGEAANPWHDIAMRRDERGFQIRLPLLTPGLIALKPYLLAADGQQHWLEGDNIHVKVQPASWRANNGIYSVYLRQYGRPAQKFDQEQRRLEEAGYTVLPPSGCFDDLIADLARIVNQMGFRIIQMLPIFPVPTNYARMGQFGSPYASLNFLTVNPEYARFSTTSSPNQQFEKLLDAVHSRSARLIIDLPANHTGWGSFLHDLFPDYFKCDQQGNFCSPGAWGVVWEDLIQLDYRQYQLQRYMVEVFCHWVRLGVDGFRLDAGYMLPVDFWHRVVSTVRRSHPETLFLLEGLGGDLNVTRQIVQQAGVNWAYSELFQAYTSEQLRNYLPYLDRESRTTGELFNFAETHDNPRLAATSPAYARFRCILNALLSDNGCFGISNGVEHYNCSKIDVHLRQPLRIDRSGPSMEALLCKLNQLLARHPAFSNMQAKKIIDVGNPEVLAVGRAELLLLFNPGDHEQTLRWPPDRPRAAAFDLLSARQVPLATNGSHLEVKLPAWGSLCLAETTPPTTDNSLERYQHQAWRALLLQILAAQAADWQQVDYSDDYLAEQLCQLRADPLHFLGEWRVLSLALDPLNPETSPGHGPHLFEGQALLLPQAHYLFLHAQVPFKVEVYIDQAGGRTLHRSCYSLADETGQQRWLFSPAWLTADHPQTQKWSIRVHRYYPEQRHSSDYHIYSPQLQRGLKIPLEFERSILSQQQHHYGLMSNQRGSYTMVAARFGEKYSKYDGWLAYNPASSFPADRLLLLSGLQVWLRWRDYSYALDVGCQHSFRGGADNQLWWQFRLQLNRDYHLEVRLLARLDPHDDALCLSFHRPPQLLEAKELQGELLPPDQPCTLIIRPQLEQRNFHQETRQKDFHATLEQHASGFRLQLDRQRFTCSLANSQWVDEPCWKDGAALDIDEERGMLDRSYLFVPGYFKVKFSQQICQFLFYHEAADIAAVSADGDLVPPASLEAEQLLRQALRRFVVRRDHHWTVLAGFPWFLDWGRDTFIVLRGLIAAGELDYAGDIITCFAGYEQQGMLPNIICGERVGNYDTADAPLWLIHVVAELLPHRPNLLDQNCRGRSLAAVLESIITHYIGGCANGVLMDPGSALIYSPVHFTWMDTNHPSGTPRQGYPIEIQALWYSALSFACRHLQPRHNLLQLLQESFERYYWLAEEGFFSDCLHATSAGGAATATADDALRPNQLLAISLGLANGQRALSSLQSCRRLLVPGAIRSLANRTVKVPLEVRHHGQLLNDPAAPYWPSYRGDEDYRRKPAYHNGTAWHWLFPSYCEAWVKLGGDCESARAMLLASLLLDRQAIPGFLPEICDGSAPHHWRGCPAQAWSVSETLRLLLLLDGSSS